jgi:acyl carrier protein phosphodiesterase
MNFLVHFYIADITADMFIGQFLGDFVKGRHLEIYSFKVRSGILFHRKIDSFSDAHAVTGISRERFSSRRRRFAGVIVDVCYDHFLARHWHHFGKGTLDAFSQKVYHQLNDHSHLLSDHQKMVLARMIEYNWLGSYYHLEHVGTALDRIAGRLNQGRAFLGSIDEVKANYQELEADFKSFFPELISFCKNYKP